MLLLLTAYLDYSSKFRSQSSDNKYGQIGEKSQRRKRKKKENQRRERVRRKTIQVREKVEKLRDTVFFPVSCGSGWSKSRLAEAAGAEPSGEMRDQKNARRCGPKHARDDGAIWNPEMAQLVNLHTQLAISEKTLLKSVKKGFYKYNYLQQMTHMQNINGDLIVSHCILIAIHKWYLCPNQSWRVTCDTSAK